MPQRPRAPRPSQRRLRAHAVLLTGERGAAQLVAARGRIERVLARSSDYKVHGCHRPAGRQRRPQWWRRRQDRPRPRQSRPRLAIGTGDVASSIRPDFSSRAICAPVDAMRLARKTLGRSGQPLLGLRVQRRRDPVCGRRQCSARSSPPRRWPPRASSSSATAFACAASAACARRVQEERHDQGRRNHAARLHQGQGRDRKAPAPASRARCAASSAMVETTATASTSSPRSRP